MKKQEAISHLNELCDYLNELDCKNQSYIFVVAIDELNELKRRIEEIKE